MGWSFRGQRILEATLATLQSGVSGADPALANFTLASTGPDGTPTRVLLGGCSAGARGAKFNIAYVQPMLPAGVELRGFFDSPYWVDVEPFADAPCGTIVMDGKQIIPVVVLRWPLHHFSWALEPTRGDALIVVR